MKGPVTFGEFKRILNREEMKFFMVRMIPPKGKMKVVYISHIDFLYQLSSLHFSIAVCENQVDLSELPVV